MTALLTISQAAARARTGQTNHRLTRPLAQAGLVLQPTSHTSAGGVARTCVPSMMTVPECSPILAVALLQRQIQRRAGPTGALDSDEQTAAMHERDDESPE